MGISAVIIAFNESAKIADCINSVSWADEIIVVDSHSTDDTRDIAAAHGAIVIERDWLGFSQQKQFATNEAKNDWVFSIDADEMVTSELANEVASIDLNSADAFRMPRLSHYLGKAVMHGSWYPDLQIRLFNKKACRWSEDAVHESVIVPSARISDLRSHLLHYSVDSISAHVEMIISRYAPLGAEKLRQQGRISGVRHLIFSGPAAFVSGYFLKLGVLDGTRGLLIAVLAGFNAFLKHALRYEQQLNASDADSTANTTVRDEISS